MPSAFERVVKSVIKEVGGGSRGDLIPVDCLRNSTSFRPYSLLSRKLSSSWFWKPRYTCVNLSIKDILEPNTPEPEPECSGHFQVSDVIDGTIEGSVTLSGTGEGKISGGAAVSDSSSASMNVCILRVTQNTWETMQRDRHLQQPENKILQQLRSRGDDVFVVTEVLQTKEEVQITHVHKQEGSGQCTLPGVLCLQGEGKGHQSRKKMVTIPAGSILAFRVAQLLIGSKWDILLVSDEKQRTFEPPSGGQRARGAMAFVCSLRCIPSVSNSSSYGIHDEEEISEDFQGLDTEVKVCSLELESLEMELRQQLLVDIGRLLQDQPGMEVLEASLEQGLCSGGQVEPLDGPAGSVLEYLVLDSGELVPELAAPIFYLLGALTVLSETQQQLLAKALETTTVLSKQLELVKHVLEQSTPWQEQSSVSLPSGLLGDSWDEEAPTWVLLEECGLRLQVEPPHVHWEPTSQGPTCALYASLALLSCLGQKPG
ncbi:Gasdermin-D [Apodemus speciosus]|uniref:Gasdermin-D n=1 Tax=Apodemus speciosus TaxID=105296 RepID=A0ABQ0FJS2_APOSI